MKIKNQTMIPLTFMHIMKDNQYINNLKIPRKKDKKYNFTNKNEICYMLLSDHDIIKYNN